MSLPLPVLRLLIKEGVAKVIFLKEQFRSRVPFLILVLTIWSMTSAWFGVLPTRVRSMRVLAILNAHMPIFLNAISRVLSVISILIGPSREKPDLSGGWARDLANFQTSTNFQLANFASYSSSYFVGDRFWVTPVWQITQKTALRLRYEYSVRDYLGSVVSFPDSRHDSMHSGQVSLDWEPIRAIALSALLQRNHRSSNLRGFDYDNIAGSISVRLNF